MSNSYQQTIDANAEMLVKAEKMYKTDLQNTLLQKGKSVDQIRRQEQINAINEKLNMLRNEKKKAIEESTKKYNRDSSILNAIYDNSEKSTIILRKQDKELRFNNNKISEMKGDMLTLRRQVEISADETNKRNLKLLILKAILCYSLLVCIPILLGKNQTISEFVQLVSIGVLSALFGLIMLIIMYRNRNNNNLRHSVLNWTKPTIDNVLENDKIEEENKISNIQKLLMELEAKKKNALLKEDYDTAKEITNKINAIRKALAEGDEFGGLGSEEKIAQYRSEIKSLQKEFAENARQESYNQLEEVKEQQNKNEEKLAKLQKDLENNELNETNIKDLIKDLKKTIADTDERIKMIRANVRK